MGPTTIKTLSFGSRTWVSQIDDYPNRVPSSLYPLRESHPHWQAKARLVVVVVG